MAQCPPPYASDQIAVFLLFYAATNGLGGSGARGGKI